jgi:hypothetical protein
MQRPDLATLACVNPECQYFGRPHQDNLTIRVFFPAPRLCSIEVIAEFKALYYWRLQGAACKINQQIAS